MMSSENGRHGQTGGLDRFRILAALLIVAVHTSPLSSFSSGGDFLLTEVIARIAVPFFLMITGQFVLTDSVFHRSSDHSVLLRFLRRTVLLYVLATFLYLPVNLYAGHYHGLNGAAVLRLIFFDGTFYHLWYLPACIIGVLLIYALSRRMPFRGVMLISLLLYGVGLLGDSYFGLTVRVPFLALLYRAGFHVFSYTRNGLFYAPVFLAMGAWAGQQRNTVCSVKTVAGFICSMLLMIAEGLTLRHFNIPRHDSMYLALLPCMAFLYQLLLAWRAVPAKPLRVVSTWIYILHPLALVMVRGIARVTGLAGVLVRNSLIQYLAVCALSIAFSAALARFLTGRERRNFRQGRAWIELDRNALHHNVQVLQSLLPDGCRLMPVVKAEAYGHGAALIARELNAMGIRSFCVASAAEGAGLRRQGIRGDILVLGYTHPEQFFLLRRYHLIQTVIDYPFAEALNGYGQNFRVHVGIDTGMHRLGESWDRTDELCEIFRMKHLKIEGIFTHLCADDVPSAAGRALTMRQARAFAAAAAALEGHGFHCPEKHLLASYGLLNYPELSGNYARVGIALYGMLSTRADTERWAPSLQPVLSLKARIATVRELHRGETVGYGLQTVATRDMRIAALTIGYADGLPRSLSGGVGSVLINGRKASILGRICMDQTLVDVTGIPDVQMGGIAVVIGRSGGKSITACDIAEQTGTIANEILSRLGGRLERQMI